MGKGVLAILGGPGFKDSMSKKDEPEEGSDESADEDIDLGAKTKEQAVKTLFAAMKKGDVAAGVKALEAWDSCKE